MRALVLSSFPPFLCRLTCLSLSAERRPSSPSEGYRNSSRVLFGITLQTMQKHIHVPHDSRVEVIVRDRLRRSIQGLPKQRSWQCNRTCSGNLASKANLCLLPNLKISHIQRSPADHGVKAVKLRLNCTNNVNQSALFGLKTHDAIATPKSLQKP